MTGPTPDERFVLELDRHYPAPPERLWQAWTTEQGLAGWWWAGWQVDYAVDLRVGGSYRIDATEQGIGVHGEYLVIDEPRRLEFSWIWVSDGVDEATERVVVEFVATDDGTTVIVRHGGGWTTAEPVERYRQGWDHVLDRLQRTLSGA